MTLLVVDTLSHTIRLVVFQEVALEATGGGIADR